MYGVPLSSEQAIKDVCAGCLGRKNEELANEPTVLCDGKKCGREYHLRCCLPPLTLDQIPEGPYLCIDCDPDGTSSQLEGYFENIAESRSNFATSREYVESLFEGSRIPVSELQRVTELHRDAVATVEHMAAASATLDEPMGADFLIGKPLRLYCPVGNSYHNGRIIDWRRATHLRPIMSSSPQDGHNFLFGEMSEFARCEFLVSFPAGLDFRKRTVHQWMILEEHSLAVGTSLIWCLHECKKGLSPGITWLRTSLELIPVLEMLSEAEGQVHYDASNIGQTKTWALTQIFGEETHLLLILREEAVDFFSPCLSEGFHKTTNSGGIDIPILLACTEIEEQRRIRRWYHLQLQNAVHERALTIADESMLPPLEITPPDFSADDTITVTLGPRPCPLIRRGLDRMWIMEQVACLSKDAAASLSCKQVKSRASAIRQLQEEATKGGTTAT